MKKVAAPTLPLNESPKKIGCNNSRSNNKTFPLWPCSFHVFGRDSQTLKVTRLFFKHMEASHVWKCLSMVATKMRFSEETGYIQSRLYNGRIVPFILKTSNQIFDRCFCDLLCYTLHFAELIGPHIRRGNNSGS